MELMRPGRTLLLHLKFTLLFLSKVLALSSLTVFYLFVFQFLIFNGRWMKVNMVFCLFFICHLLGFLLSDTLHELSAASRCSFLHHCFYCHLLCPWCQSPAFKNWLNILLPTFKLWSLSPYMDVSLWLAVPFIISRIYTDRLIYAGLFILKNI